MERLAEDDVVSTDMSFMHHTEDEMQPLSA